MCTHCVTTVVHVHNSTIDSCMCIKTSQSSGNLTLFCYRSIPFHQECMYLSRMGSHRPMARPVLLNAKFTGPIQPLPGKTYRFTELTQCMVAVPTRGYYPGRNAMYGGSSYQGLLPYAMYGGSSYPGVPTALFTLTAPHHGFALVPLV